jgi:Holliday junction resolvasome RuvABC endonuclease subunit
MNQTTTNKYFIGIDASTSRTGIAWVHTNPLEADIKLHTASIVPPKGMKDEKRLQYLYDKFTAILMPFSGELYACIEEASLNSIGRQIPLAEVRGVLKLAASLYNVTLIGIAPKALKKFGTGYGGASKEDMIRAAGKAGWTVNNGDEADAAIAAGVVYSYFNRDKLKLKRKQLEVLVKLN